MIARRNAAAVVLCVFLGSLAMLGGCSSLQTKDPLQVTVAGIEPLQSQGQSEGQGQGMAMELRLLVKLRVQNPNDAAVDFNGVALEMNVQGKTLASGVSAESGSVPRFGETVIEVPMTISAFRMVRQAIGMMQGGGVNKISYEMKGKLSTSSFSATRFTTKGEFDLGAVTAPPPQA